uniref:CSON015184 protein n=1 Tax=Culicoides sonorensis TaxID=179676 RepID=A0A336LRL5_CULSO
MKRVKIVILLIFINIHFGFASKAKYIQAKKFTQCKDFKNLTTDFSELVTVNEKNGVKMSGSFTVRNEIKGDMDMQLDTRRCTPEGRQCSSFTNNTITSICDSLKKNIIFGDKMETLTTPSLTCFPLKPGKYVISDFLFDGSSIQYLPIEGHQWSVRALIYAGGKPHTTKYFLGCIEIVFNSHAD